MNTKFRGIKVLIWDFDGTFYKPNAELFAKVREAEYRVIMEHTGWNHDKTIAQFNTYYKTVTPSATQTVAHICGITTTEAAFIMEKYYDRRQSITRDEKLISLFKKLPQYQHYILANGVRHRLEETLAVLGVPKETFMEIVTSEQAGENKPSDKGFRYILGKTVLPAGSHLMIGDRESVDIVPAKKLGMHTCLVWSDTKSSIADVTLPSVYEIQNIL